MSEARFWRAVVLLAAAAAVLAFVAQVWNILIPFLLGLVIAYLVYPLVDRFVAMGLLQDRVVIILYALLLGLGVGLGSWLIPTLYQEANAALLKVPAFAQAIDVAIDRFNDASRDALRHLIGANADHFVIPFRVDAFFENLVVAFPAHIIGMMHFGLWIFIVPFVSFFALSHGRRWMDAVFNWTPSAYVESLLGLLAEINATLGGFVRGVLLEAMVVGVLTALGLWALGLEGAILLGFVTGVLNIVPFMAPVVGGGLALLVAYFQGKGLFILVMIVVLYAVIRLIDDFVLIPGLVGHIVRLHPVVTLFAILAGYEFAGLIGLVFAIPAAAVIKVILSALVRSRRPVPLNDAAMAGATGDNW